MKRCTGCCKKRIRSSRSTVSAASARAMRLVPVALWKGAARACAPCEGHRVETEGAEQVEGTGG